MALLADVRGAASDPDGKITAESLRSYLYNSMKDFLPERDRSNPDIAKEPDVSYVSGDGGDLIFLELPPSDIPHYAVSLQLPPHSLGQLVEILGAQLEVVASVPAVESWSCGSSCHEACTWRASGRPGTGCSSWVSPETSSVSLSIRGPKVRCRIEASEATAQIVVTLGQSEPVAKGHGVLLVELPPGLYKATMRVGFAVPLGPSQSLSLVDRPLSPSRTSRGRPCG